MDPSAASPSPLSSLSQPQLSSSSSEHLSWQLQKPTSFTSKAPYNPSPMSPFNHPFGCSSPFFDAYPDQTGDSIEQSFTGGDDPLLTSSWEALDKLVSASMTASATTTDQSSDLASMQTPPVSAALQCTSPNSLSDAVDQKPLSALYGSLHQRAGNLWSGNHANASTTTSSNNVGINLASFISADPAFVERAAKFSSYSQQINGSSLVQINKNCHIDPVSKAEYNVDGAACSGVRKLITNNINAANQISRSRSSNVALQQQDVKYNVNVPINESNNNNSDKHGSPPPASMVSLSGSKKKREVLMKDCEDDDIGGNLGWKRAKGGEREDQNVSNGNNNSNKTSSKVLKTKAAFSSEKSKQCGASNSGESEQKSEVCLNNKTPSSSPSPPPKPDYIHVRARRGQATDSHSLAERVRREKISERMKYLQDLVPGCTKVTGKAMMLDEIINYVQSLQRQVEFLSMKLATVHPSKLEFNFESLFGKEVLQQPTLHSNCSASGLTPLLETPALLNSSSFLQGKMQSLQHNSAFMESMNPTSAALHSLGPDPSLRRTLSMLTAASSDSFGDCISQISDAWVDDDLQNIVPPLPGFSQSPLSLHPSLQGALLNSQMKMEL